MVLFETAIFLKNGQIPILSSSKQSLYRIYQRLEMHYYKYLIFMTCEMLVKSIDTNEHQ